MDPNIAFTLRLKLYRSEFDKRLIVIKVWDSAGWDSAGRTKLEIEVRHGGKVIFPRGALNCALHDSSDGIAARELVLATVGMRPGDTDSEYFDSYTDEQKEWAMKHGEGISDHETGAVRS